MRDPKTTEERNYNDLILLARLLDNQFQGPMGIKFGLDALIGLIPGIGDFITSGLSSYILLRAALLKLPLPLLIQMAINILIDQIIGVIPLLGDLFDIYWKSNQKNVELIKNYAQSGERVPSYIFLNIIVILILISLILFIPLFLLFQLFFVIFN